MLFIVKVKLAVCLFSVASKFAIYREPKSLEILMFVSRKIPNNYVMSLRLIVHIVLVINFDEIIELCDITGCIWHLFGDSLMKQKSHET